MQPTGSHAIEKVENRCQKNKVGGIFKIEIKSKNDGYTTAYQVQRGDGVWDMLFNIHGKPLVIEQTKVRKTVSKSIREDLFFYLAGRIVLTIF
jgi:hypothetical protein